MGREKLRNSINELVSTAQRQNYNEITQKIKELVPKNAQNPQANLQFPIHCTILRGTKTTGACTLKIQAPERSKFNN